VGHERLEEQVTYRNDAHQSAVEHRDRVLREFYELRGDFNGGFRASIPKLTKAQVALSRAENAITALVHADIKEKRDAKAGK